MVKKGVSPVVAVVLLVGLAISAGVLTSNWFTHLISTQMIDETGACGINTRYIIDSVEFNRSGDDFLLIKLTNKDEKGLYDFGVMLDNGTNIVNLNSSNRRIDQRNITSDAPLTREQSAYIAVNLTINYTGLGKTLTQVRVFNDACNDVAAQTTSITQY